MKVFYQLLKSSLIAAILFTCVIIESNAQSNWEAGLRFGNPNVAIDATIPIGAAPRLHPAIYISDVFAIGTYFDWLFGLTEGPQGLKFYPGVGPEFIFSSNFEVRIAGNFGVEYAFDFPLTVAFDWRPGFFITSNFAWTSNNIGVTARFRFAEGVKFKRE